MFVYSILYRKERTLGMSGVNVTRVKCIGRISHLMKFSEGTKGKNHSNHTLYFLSCSRIFGIFNISSLFSNTVFLFQILSEI